MVTAESDNKIIQIIAASAGGLQLLGQLEAVKSSEQKAEEEKVQLGKATSLLQDMIAKTSLATSLLQEKAPGKDTQKNIKDWCSDTWQDAAAARALISIMVRLKQTQHIHYSLRAPMQSSTQALQQCLHACVEFTTLGVQRVIECVCNEVSHSDGFEWHQVTKAGSYSNTLEALHGFFDSATILVKHVESMTIHDAVQPVVSLKNKVSELCEYSGQLHEFVQTTASAPQNLAEAQEDTWQKLQISASSLLGVQPPAALLLNIFQVTGLNTLCSVTLDALKEATKTQEISLLKCLKDLVVEGDAFLPNPEVMAHPSDPPKTNAQAIMNIAKLNLMPRPSDSLRLMYEMNKSAYDWQLLLGLQLLQHFQVSVARLFVQYWPYRVDPDSCPDTIPVALCSSAAVAIQKWNILRESMDDITAEEQQSEEMEEKAEDEEEGQEEDKDKETENPTQAPGRRAPGKEPFSPAPSLHWRGGGGGQREVTGGGGEEPGEGGGESFWPSREEETGEWG